MSLKKKLCKSHMILIEGFCMKHGKPSLPLELGLVHTGMLLNCLL